MFCMWFLLLIITVKTYSDSVEYYEKIIRKGIEESKHYVFPKDAMAYKPKNEGEPIYFGNFDYVVIGGGSAGAVVASRLSEVSTWTVLLLEAGERENDFTDIPATSPYTLKSDYNWGFNSTPQATCCLEARGVCAYPRGKALGGSTVLNALIYSRGNALDYDRWAEEGNPGWSYADVLPFFIKSEKSYIYGDVGYHGYDGYLDVDYHRPLSKRARIFINANVERGLNAGDYNGQSQLRTGPTQFTISNGRRVSSAKAFLRPAVNRTNLHILTGSYVTKIAITGKIRRASQVVFSKGNVEYYVKVRKEVVLSAGVFGSPHVLMLSGIGPLEHLKQLGIPTQVNLNVGKGLHDHVSFYNLYFNTITTEPSYGIKEAIEQYLQGKGPLTISTNPQSLSFYAFAKTNSSVPDFEITFIPSIKSIEDLLKNENKSYTFQMVLILLHPRTRGSVFLQSSSPYLFPLINSKCLDDPENQDIENLFKGIQIVLDLMDTEAFKPLKPKLVPYKPCVNNNFLSKEYWLCTIRQTALNAYHGGGTCRMGPNPLKGDVVDNKLQVYGVSNLRVADTSIVPVTLSAHMSAPAMMIGEKAAELIKSANNKHGFLL